jgi:hypothetical protein
MIKIRTGRILIALIVASTSLFNWSLPALGQPAIHSSHRTIRITSQKIVLPPGTKQFHDGRLAKIANTYCLMCHSREMIDTQPPLTVTSWEKEIAKMRAVYGCPLNPDQATGLAQFIAQSASQGAHQ